MQNENVPTDNAEMVLLKIKSDALRLLSFSSRSVVDLRNRLKQKKYPDALIDQAIDSLKKQGLVNDEKFAKLFAESRLYSRPTGRRQLEIDLKKKGLSQELVQKTVSELKDYDEKPMVRELILKRLKGMSGISKEKKRMRLYGLLKRRGFGGDAIFSVMDEFFKKGGIEDLEFRESSNED